MSLKKSEELNTIDKLIKKINEINIPIYTIVIRKSKRVLFDREN